MMCGESLSMAGLESPGLASLQWQRQMLKKLRRQAQLPTTGSPSHVELPQDIVCLILSRLSDVRSRNAASLVCRAWSACERATRNSLALRACLRDLVGGALPSCFAGTGPAQPCALPPPAGATPPLPRHPQGNCLDDSATKGEAVSTRMAAHAMGERCATAPDLSTHKGTGVQALDLSLLWPWGESLLEDHSPALLPRPSHPGAETGQCSTASCVQAALMRAFPNVVALRVYLRCAADISCITGAWERQQLRHLSAVRLNMDDADLTLHLPAFPEAAAPALPEGPTSQDDDKAGSTSALARLLMGFPGLETLDLSHFLCLPEDIPAGLGAVRGTAHNLKLLDLIKISPRGLYSAELAAVAAACPQLQVLRCACEFDARLEGVVEDEALVALAKSCPNLAHLHLCDFSMLTWPLMEKLAPGDASEATDPDSWHAPEGNLSSLCWQHTTSPSPECFGKAAPFAAPLVQGQNGNSGTPVPVAVSAEGLCAALVLLPSLAHLGLLLPSPPVLRPTDGDRRQAGVGAPVQEPPQPGQQGHDTNGTRDLCSEGWWRLDLASVCPKLRSLELCPLGNVADCLLAGAAPSSDARGHGRSSTGKVDVGGQKPGHSWIPLPPSLTSLHLRAGKIAHMGCAQGEGEGGVGFLSRVALSCPRLRMLSLWGLDGIQPCTLHAALTIIRPTLRHLSVLHCGSVPTVPLLHALAPVRASLRSLELSTGSNVLPIRPALTDHNGSSEGDGTNAGTFPHTQGHSADEGAVQGWPVLQRLSLWVPLGQTLEGLLKPEAGLLGLSCPALQTLGLAVAGDSRSLPSPGLTDFGLGELAAHPRLTTIVLDLSGISGYSLSCPRGTGDVNIWERFHVNGVDQLGACAAVHFCPAYDCDTQKHSFSLTSASLLASAPALRKLSVHGCAGEHALAQLSRARTLRDVKLIEDCFLPGAAGSQDLVPMPKFRRASLQRVLNGLKAKQCPD